jgi:hypothetical protein
MSRGKPQSAPAGVILLLDVLAAWEAVEDDHGVKLKVELSRVSGEGPGALQAAVKVVETPLDAPGELDINARWSWPTKHHKTFLGMLHWLLHQVDSEITAQRCLAELPAVLPRVIPE